MLRIFGLVALARAADVVFAPNLDEYYGTTVDVKCSIDRGMEITLTAPLAAKGMRFMLAGDPKCRLEKNGNYHTIQTRLSGCNNEIFMDSSTLTIANTIVNTMTFGRNAVKIESPVGCLFHSQEVSIGVLLEENIPVEIAPTPQPTTSDEGTESDYDSEYDGEYGDETTGDAPVARGGIPTTESGGDKPQRTPEDVQGQPETETTNDSQDTSEDPSGPVDTKTDNQTTESRETEDGVVTTDQEEKNQTETSPESNQGEENQDEISEGEAEDKAEGESQGENEAFTTVSPGSESDGSEEERVNINFVTTAPTAGPKGPTSRVTTTTQPKTKELVQGIILIDNGHEFEDDEPEKEVVESPEEESIEVNIIAKEESDEPTSDQTTARPNVEVDEPNEVDTSVDKGNEQPSDESENRDNETEEEEDVLEPIDLDPRSCPTPELCRIDGRRGKGKKPKQEKKETLWRVVARGDGLFFARMHLFTDETFSKAWMYPPSLRSNDTIYAGVVLANGPAEATVSLTSCWASNTRHEIVNMKQPELQPNEITLPLIEDGCAVKSPPNLVNMVENGETAQAKFTSSVFQFVGYDTAYLYCRVRVCPLGPCPQTCDDAEPEYEYYDLDVGLGIHGEPEEVESSGEEIFDMPSFEALIGDKPGKSGKEYDPYSGSTGPLVAATLYRKYEYAEGIKTDGEIVIEKTETNVVDNIFGNSSLTQAVLLGLLGAACCTLLMLSIFVIKKRNREKKLVQ